MIRYLVAVNHHRVTLDRAWIESAKDFDPFVFPEHVVLGFRAIFWKAFTAVHHLPPGGEFELVGRRWRLKRLVVLRSDHAIVRLGLPDDDSVIIVSMLIETEGDPETYDLNAETSRLELNEQQFVSALVSALSKNPHLWWLSSLKHDRDFAGRYIMRHKPEYGEQSEALALYGFHYFGILMFWRIARDQVSINLSSDPLQIERNGDDLLALRQRIINMERLFLTNSISNNAGLRALSKDCKSQQRIAKRFRGLPLLNERIEKYFEIVAQLSAQRDQRLLNIIVSIIAILGLPVSLMSMMLAISTRAEVVASPDKLFGRADVRYFLFACVIGTAAALVLMATIFTARWSRILIQAARRRLRRRRR